MTDTQTYIVRKKRTISSAEQHVCNICKEPAVYGCTDATETQQGWKQSKPRYGCKLHPVVSVVEYLKNADKKTN